MLKAMLPLSTAFGLLYAVPTVVQDQPRTLSDALTDTVHALEVLRGYRAGSAGGFDPQAVKSVTEDPIADPDERMARLDQLNVELQRMQTHLELLRSGTLLASTPLDLSTDRPLVPTVGLGDGEVARLVLGSKRVAISGSIGSDGGASYGPQVPPRTPIGSDGATYGVESPGPNAAIDTESAPASGGDATPAPAPRDDALGFSKARAAYFAEQYDTALAGFEQGPDDSKHAYWRGRCLEQLGRAPEALELYQRVAADPGAGDLVERAKSDADFLRWKIEFEGGSNGGAARSATDGTPNGTTPGDGTSQ